MGLRSGGELDGELPTPGLSQRLGANGSFVSALARMKIARSGNEGINKQTRRSDHDITVPGAHHARKQTSLLVHINGARDAE